MRDIDTIMAEAYARATTGDDWDETGPALRARILEATRHAIGTLADAGFAIVPRTMDDAPSGLTDGDGTLSGDDLPADDVRWLMCEAYESRFEPHRQRRLQAIARELKEHRARAFAVDGGACD
jgi:hypothetical protein